MEEFKVGDRVAAAHDCDIYYKKGNVGTVVEVCTHNEYRVDFDKVPGVHVTAAGDSIWYVSYLTAEDAAASRANDPATSKGARKVTCRMSAHKEAYRAARATDPATSKGKRKVNKYAECVLFLLGRNPEGLTGHEMSKLSGFPLNCITPRFAPLRRAAKIRAKLDANQVVKRDKQIVWVLA